MKELYEFSAVLLLKLKDIMIFNIVDFFQFV